MILFLAQKVTSGESAELQSPNSYFVVGRSQSFSGGADYPT